MSKLKELQEKAAIEMPRPIKVAVIKQNPYFKKF